VTRDSTERRIVGGLLKGGCRIFGARVELSWPDGLPYSFTENELRDIGEQMTAGEPQWILADAEFCAAAARCGKVLVNGECERHGKVAT
jgi:hypothetical protein